MNRIIKFRGKYAQAHEWVYGHYYNNCDCGANHDIIIGYNPETLSAEEYLIKYQFLGQFTGLKDKNGKEIFDGDILFSKNRIKNKYCTVYFDNKFASFCTKDENGVRLLSNHLQNNDCIIAGNIYDNPELLQHP